MRLTSDPQQVGRGRIKKKKDVFQQQGMDFLTNVSSVTVTDRVSPHPGLMVLDLFRLIAAPPPLSLCEDTRGDPFIDADPVAPGVGNAVYLVQSSQVLRARGSSRC